MMRAIGMSPSPGTNRCDDATVPTLKSLTCTRRMQSTPSAIVAARSRSAQQALSSMHTPVPSRRARSIASRNVCTKPTSTRSELVCSIANSTSLARACCSTGARARSSASAASSHVRGANGPVVNTMRSAPTATAVSIERTRRSRCASHCSGCASRNGPRPIRSTTCNPRATAAVTSSAPFSHPYASSFATETPARSIPCAAQKSRSSGSDNRNVQIALTHAADASR